MDTREGVPTIDRETLESLLHPTEDSRFALALFVAIPAAIIGALLVFVTFGILLVYIGLMVGMVWFGMQIAKAQLMANTVRVSERNFPAVHQVVEEVKATLGCEESIEVYIVEDGTVNAMLAKFFQTRFIILNSELVEDMLAQETLVQMKWIIARFVGALQAKHHRLDLWRILIDGIEKIKVFNLLILPYERATKYSGDQIGLAVCGDLGQAMIAFDKFMVGNKLARQVGLAGMLQQSNDVRGRFFPFLARLGSAHPHVMSRFTNLLSFARQRYPAMFAQYLAQHDIDLEAVEQSLPDYIGPAPAVLSLHEAPRGVAERAAAD